jgi:hypothetical protein
VRFVRCAAESDQPSAVSHRQWCFNLRLLKLNKAFCFVMPGNEASVDCFGESFKRNKVHNLFFRQQTHIPPQPVLTKERIGMTRGGALTNETG